MGGWRTKFIFTLVVYFAGFATAIYCLAPTPEGNTYQHSEKNFAYSTLKSDEFAHSFNTGMHKCLDFAKDAACRAGVFIKQQYDSRNLKSDS